MRLAMGPGSKARQDEWIWSMNHAKDFSKSSLPSKSLGPLICPAAFWLVPPKLVNVMPIQCGICIGVGRFVQIPDSLVICFSHVDSVLAIGSNSVAVLHVKELSVG